MSWPGLHCRALMPCLWKRDHSELAHCKRWPKGHGLFNFHLLRFCPMAQYTQVCLEESRFEPCFGCRVGGGGFFFFGWGGCFRCRCPPQVGDLRWKFGRNLTAPSNIYLSHTHLTFKVSNVVLPCRGRAAVNAPKKLPGENPDVQKLGIHRAKCAAAKAPQGSPQVAPPLGSLRPTVSFVSKLCIAVFTVFSVETWEDF